MNIRFFDREAGVRAVAFDKAGSRKENIVAAFSCAPDRLSVIDQVHSTVIKTVTKGNFGECTEADGMVTNVPGIPLVIQTADCIPVFLYDPVRGAAGVVHSGRKGCAGNIIAAAVTQMKNSFHTDPSDLLIGIGPCICGKCYELGSETMEDFRPNFSEAQIRRIFTPGANGKYFGDNKQALRMSIAAAGIPDAHVEDCGICTFEDRSFESYRRTCKENTRNDYYENRSVIMLV